MPRDLADVLHYFLPEIEGAPAMIDRGRRPLAHEPVSLTLPILGLPIGDRDVVRAALAWNLAIETSRLGGATVMLAPASGEGSPLWPAPGMGPLGTELVLCPATDLDGLYRAAHELAKSRARTARHGGIVFVRDRKSVV